MVRFLQLAALLSLALPLPGRLASPRTSSVDLPADLEPQWKTVTNLWAQRDYPAVVQQGQSLARIAEQRGLDRFRLRVLAYTAGAQIHTFQYRAASQTYLRALQIADALHDQPMAGLISFNLSNVYYHLGALEQSISALDRANELAAAGNALFSHIELTLHRGRILARSRGLAAAQPLLDRALSLATAAGDRPRIAMIHDLIAVLHMQAGDLDQADAESSAALQARGTGNDPLLSSTLLTLSRLRLQQSRPTEALALANKAFDELRRHAPQRPLFRFFQYRGEALAALGRLHEARHDLLAAVDRLRPLRPDLLPSESIGMHAAASHQEVFSSLAAVCNQLHLQTGQPAFLEEAFSFTLENRALAMRTALAGRRDPSPAYAALLSSLQSAELAALRSASPENADRLAAARLKLSEFQLAATSNPAVSLQPPSVPAILAALPSDAAIILLEARPRHSSAWTIAQGRLKLTLLPPEPELLALASRHSQLLEQDSPAAATAGHDLYAALFSTLPPAVRHARRWMILPDRFLFSIPFAALVPEFDGEQPHYLAEQLALQVSPFLAPPQSPLADHPSDHFTAFGDPIYNAADPRATPSGRFPWLATASHGDTPADLIALPRLPGTAREIRLAADAWRGPSSLFTGKQVSLANLRLALAARPEVLHLATHLVPSPADPAESRLLLSLNSSGQPELLDPSTIASLPASCPLIVMSGCRAGAASSIASEGLLGLSRAWLTAGASTVLATQWPMPDDSGDLWHSFYSAWRTSALPPGSARAAQALHSAQRDAIASRSWRARPRYWASYFVLGSQFLYGHLDSSQHGRRLPRR